MDCVHGADGIGHRIVAGTQGVSLWDEHVQLYHVTMIIVVCLYV